MNYFVPKYITNYAIALYFLLLLTISTVFMRAAMSPVWMVFGVVEVASFFFLSNFLTKAWGPYSEMRFVQSLLLTSLLLRMAYVVFSYFFYTENTGSPFNFDAADALWYDDMGRQGAALLNGGKVDLLNQFQIYSKSSISDLGYPIYLSVVYFLTDNSIMMTRLLKAVWSAWTVLLVYRLAQRNFGEYVARTAAVMCMLMPNFLFYCGLHLKETEMVFLMMVFLERADYALRQGKFVFTPTLVAVLAGLYLFMFRTVLAAVLFISFFMALTMASTKLLSWGRRLLVIVLALSLLGLMFSDNIANEVKSYSETDVQGYQQSGYEYRGTSNSYARYASAAVFAPLIFTIPFPTMVEIPGQENVRMIHGGNFCKSITSFFTLFALLTLIKPYNWRRKLFDGEWRKHIMIIAALLGYLVVLVFSNFAHSERFHLPSLPMALMFAAYGIANYSPKWKRWYWVWLGVIFVANIGWAYIKLKGRGL